MICKIEQRSHGVVLLLTVGVASTTFPGIIRFSVRAPWDWWHVEIEKQRSCVD